MATSTEQGPSPTTQPQQANYGYPYVPGNTEPKDYGSAKAYAEAVRNWSGSVQCWMAWQQMTAWHSFTTQMQQQMASFSALNVQPQAGQRLIPPVGINIRHILRFIGVQNGAQQTIIAAESIDFFLLFIFKMFIVYFLVEIELVDLDQFVKILSNDADLKIIIDVTQDLFHIEVLCKIFSAIVEAFFLTYGFMSYPPGCTPGKYIMGLQVVSCLSIQSVPGAPGRVQVTRSPGISLKNAMIRSMLKNMVTNFLFPLSTVFYVFNYNRAIYDIAAKTVVVSM
ncbi:RDD family protein [Aphelenchoides avenae]|nr:RDD family protein [Aphelenchus avenae]